MAGATLAEFVDVRLHSYAETKQRIVDLRLDIFLSLLAFAAFVGDSLAVVVVIIGGLAAGVALGAGVHCHKLEDVAMGGAMFLSSTKVCCFEKVVGGLLGSLGVRGL